MIDIRALAATAALAAFVLAVAAAVGAEPTGAASCTADDFAKAIDQSGARLRAYNAEASPKLQAALRRLKEKKGWTGADADDRAFEFLSDSRMQSLDQQADELYVNIDALGQPPAGGPPDCARLAELEAAASELLAVMRAKTGHTLARIDAELAGKPAAAAEKQVAAKPPAAPPAAAPKARPSAPTTADAWRPSTAVAPEAAQAAPAPPPAMTLGEDDGYTIDEIREATRGFFGTISTELASVIEHAFRKSGRPSAYILGTEGGGAFLAGLRYGKGTLYPRRGTARDIFWHGPSVGYDFGAAGSRTLFLIYGLAEPDAIHRRFAGIDGSAFLVGGVGVTYLQGGDVILAPIRTGLGLRLGASVGYLRFTPRASWNPF